MSMQKDAKSGLFIVLSDTIDREKLEKIRMIVDNGRKLGSWTIRCYACLI